MEHQKDINRLDRNFYTLDSDSKPYTICDLLRCSSFTDDEGLKQRCFNDAHAQKPGIIADREHFDSICEHIAETELKSRLEKILESN